MAPHVETAGLLTPGLTTDELAAGTLTRPQTIRKHLSVFGHFYGVVPVKLPSRRLMWPANSLELIRQAGVLARTKDSESGRQRSGLPGVRKSTEAA